MFTIDPKLTEKDLKDKNIFKVLISMNNHQVATPETSLEEARSYVFFFHEGKNRYSSYIGLHLLPTDRKLIYAHSANPFFEDELSDIEDQALDFAEYLGAMMDEVAIARMSDLERESWVEEQGFFSTKTKPETAPDSQQAAVPEQPAAAPAPAPASQQPIAPAVPEQPEAPLASAPVPQQPAATKQPETATEALNAPTPPPATVQSVTKITAAEAKEPPSEVPALKKVRQDVQAETTRPSATKHQDSEQNNAKTGTETLPKQAPKKKSYSAASVVSRDREALARLLTSF